MKNVTGVLLLCTAATLSSVVFVRGQSAAGQPDRNDPRAAPSALDGQAMFQLYCTPCHGKEGRGDGPAAKALKKVPADLTKISARNGGAFPTDKIRRFIQGQETVASHGSREMPIWGGLFTGMDRDAGMATIRVASLADYVKSIQR